MRLARSYWGIPSSIFEIGVEHSPRAILNPNFSEFRWYSPIRPCQTYSIPSIHSCNPNIFLKSTLKIYFWFTYSNIFSFTLLITLLCSNLLLIYFLYFLYYSLIYSFMLNFSRSWNEFTFVLIRILILITGSKAL